MVWQACGTVVLDVPTIGPGRVVWQACGTIVPHDSTRSSAYGCISNVMCKIKTNHFLYFTCDVERPNSSSLNFDSASFKERRTDVYNGACLGMCTFVFLQSMQRVWRSMKPIHPLTPPPPPSPPHSPPRPPPAAPPRPAPAPPRPRRPRGTPPRSAGRTAAYSVVRPRPRRRRAR